MKRSVWKWILGGALVLFVLLEIFSLGAWIAVNLLGGILLALLGNTDITGIPLSAFFENFVGSPMFWAFAADGAVIFLSAGILIVTGRKSKRVALEITQKK